MDVSNLSLQVQLAQQAKIPSNFSPFEGIFMFAGIISAPSRRMQTHGGCCYAPDKTSSFLLYIHGNLCYNL